MFRNAVLALLLVLIAPTIVYAADDIVGYRTGENWWVLGDDFEDVDLEGFAEVPDLEYGWETYIDLRRVIQFDGDDRIVTSMLMFRHDELAAIFIIVPRDEMTFRELSSYYRHRLKGCTRLINEWDQKSWVDDDSDFLLLVRSEDDVYGDSTVVTYLNRDAMEYFSGISIPGWMEDVIETWET